MAQDVLSVAWKFMRKRQFATAIKLLEGRAETYEDNFEYYLITGIACLYVGDFGAAGSYFQRARRIKITDTRLLLGQAAIYLRRGDTDRALQYYLEIKENDASNKFPVSSKVKKMIYTLYFLILMIVKDREACPWTEVQSMELQRQQ